MFNPVINEVVVLVVIVEKNEMLWFDVTDVTENQHTVKVQTHKGICGIVLTVQYLPSGEHKNYDHVLIKILQILSTFQVEIKEMGILSKDFWPLTNIPDYLVCSV